MKASDLIPGMQYYADPRLSPIVYIGYDKDDPHLLTFVRFTATAGLRSFTYIVRKPGKVGELRSLHFEPLSRYLYMCIEAHMMYSI